MEIPPMSGSQPLLNTHYDRSEALGNEITELFGFITAATYELLVKIRKFDQEKLWELEGVCSCAHWLNWKCGIGMTAARVKVRVANALADLPKISEAFRSGEISYSKVRAITRVASPDNEDYLLMIARHGTAHHVETLVSGYRRACRLNDAEIAEKQFQSRSFSYRYDDDGSVVFNGRLPPEVGAMLMKAIESAVDAADSATDDSAESWESISSRRADAIAEIAETYLETGPASSSSADRYQVMIHVTPETLESDDSAESSAALHRHREKGEARRSDPGLDDRISYLDDGPHVAAETSRRLCCDTSVIRIIEDETGEPLSIGRKSRVVPSAMRRALKARDKNCRFPGCTHRHFIDAHHMEHWANGGETSLDNLILLCRFHHRLVHEGGFKCERGPEGKIIFRNQIGVPIDESGYAMPPINDDVVVYLNEKLEDRHIHAQTCVTRWQGEKMDKGLAVSNLWELTRSANE
jgi:hypothetical protein